MVSEKPDQDSSIEKKTTTGADDKRDRPQTLCEDDQSELQQIAENLVTEELPAESPGYLLSIAKKIDRLYETRDRNLGELLSQVGEPMWKILIHLVIAAESGQQITATDLARKMNRPESLVLRYLTILEQNMYLARPLMSTQANDAGVRLSEIGFALMRNTIRALDEDTIG